MSLRKLALAAVLVALPATALAEDAGAPAYWGSPSVDGGKCCDTLARVRAQIDAIDAEIIKQMAERQKYVSEAGRFKKDPASVGAPARVEAIIAKVRADAAAAGLAPEVAERAYRAMIAAFEDFEREEWARKNAVK